MSKKEVSGTDVLASSQFDRGPKLTVQWTNRL